MERFRKLLRASPVTLILIALIGWFWFRPPASVEDLRQPAPDVPIRFLDGHELSLVGMRGKVVLVSFWATWCPYCRHELPAIDRFYRDTRSRGFEVLALSLDSADTEVTAFLRDRGYAFPAARVETGTARAFGGVSMLPTSFVIDRDGVIRHRVAGQLYYGRLEDLVLPLLPR
jgi:peroxiredoxin